MYSWDGDTTDWRGTAKYKYASSGTAAKKRSEAAKAAAARGGRTYDKKSQPVESLTRADKHVTTKSTNPLIIAIDVTGSMARWPFEIFDRLPLLYNTLVQYREDLEVCFAAIGDARYDRYPLQVTSFAAGYELEQLLGGLYGEGGGGDGPEGYGLFARWVNTHVTVPNATEPPFLIVFGDAPMHTDVKAQFIKDILGDNVRKDADAIKEWHKVIQNWNTWFLRRPTGRPGDAVDEQWGKAIGEQKIIRIKDEQRAVDFAMGLVSRAWGNFGNFQDNMRARQNEQSVQAVSEIIELKCPRCGAPIPTDAAAMFKCTYCNTTLQLT